MHKFFGLVLLSALAVVSGNRTSINGALDIFIEHMNNLQRKVGTTSAPVPQIPLDSNVKYSGAVFYGVDSIKRTTDCWEEVKGNNVTIDINYGFGLMAIALPHLEVDGKNMSAYARIRDNSVHISFTLQHSGNECHVKLNELRVEKLENVEFGASRPEFDGANLDGFFSYVVKPTLNGIVDSSFDELETSLQALCKVKNFQNAGHVEDLLRSFM